MKKIPIALAILAAMVLSVSNLSAEEKVTYTSKSLTVDTALELAKAGLEKCRKDGFQIAISVIDSGGNQQVSLRDRFAGSHTTDTAYRKAWTALSFRTDTLSLAKVTEKGGAWAIRNVTKALPLGGGILIRDGDGTVLGAVGVSGAPSGAVDVGCSKAGVAAIEDKIAF